MHALECDVVGIQNLDGENQVSANDEAMPLPDHPK